MRVECFFTWTTARASADAPPSLGVRNRNRSQYCIAWRCLARLQLVAAWIALGSSLQPYCARKSAPRRSAASHTASAARVRVLSPALCGCSTRSALPRFASPILHYCPSGPRPSWCRRTLPTAPSCFGLSVCTFPANALQL